MAASSSVDEVEPATLKAWMDGGTVLVIDVREADEHARERIAGSRLMPLSGLDPTEVPAAERVVLLCRSGRRAAHAAGRLAASGHTGVLQLRGGLEAWKAAGLPVEVNPRVPISIMRQVQILVGSLLLMGTALAALVSPWFLVVTGFFGAGLLFAGSTGTCGMAAALSLMPWNQAWRRACPRG